MSDPREQPGYKTTRLEEKQLLFLIAIYEELAKLNDAKREKKAEHATTTPSRTARKFNG